MNVFCLKHGLFQTIQALLSYRGFIAEQDLYEVKRAGDSFNELDVGYFVSESELDQYTEDERVRYESGEKAGKLRMYEKGTLLVFSSNTVEK